MTRLEMIFPSLIFLSQVFTFCPTSVFYDEPNGRVVNIEGTPNISISAVRNHYKRDPHRFSDQGWTEVMMTGGRGELLSEKTYWTLKSGLCGEFIGQ